MHGSIVRRMRPSSGVQHRRGMDHSRDPHPETAPTPVGEDAVDAVRSLGEAYQMVTRASGDSQSASPSRTENAS